MKYKVIIYGIGEQYNKNYNILKYYELTDQICIVGVTAKWIPNASSLDGYKLVSIGELHTITYDYIVIMSDIYFDEIVNDLVYRKISRDKLISYRVLQVPHLDFTSYIELKESRISIISNNCWGGVIYRTLGMECLSPFKNLSLEEEDYLKLLKNFKYYMGCNPVFLEYSYNKNSKMEYPVMLLDDVKLHCNHDTNPEEAATKWNRRKAKLNYDNLFVEMYTENRETMEKFLALEEYDRKVCFVPFQTDKQNVVQLSLYPGQSMFWETVNSNAGNGANSIVYNSLNLLLDIHPNRQEKR